MPVVAFLSAGNIEKAQLEELWPVLLDQANRWNEGHFGRGLSARRIWFDLGPIIDISIGFYRLVASRVGRPGRTSATGLQT